MKKILSLFLLLTLSLCAYSRPQTRAVMIDTVCEASMAELLPVVTRFCYQFQACPDSLFLWAYKNLDDPKDFDNPNRKRTKESRNAIQLVYKDRTYDPKEKTGDVAIDIYVLGVRWWKDQHLGTKYSLTRPVNAKYPLTAHLKATYSGSLLEQGNIIYRMEPVTPTRTRVHYEFSLTFGRVLSAFISDKTWHNAIEWRFETILANVIEYTETGTVQPRKVGPTP